MFIVHVHVRVQPDQVEKFIEATRDNASNSVQEPGCARFDVVQQADDPTRFVLAEAYYTEQDAASHKTTVHYARWRTAVDSIMAETRYSIKYANVFPGDDGW